MKERFKEALKKHIEVTDEQFEQVCTEITVKQIKKGTVLLEQGTVDNSTYYVLDGLLKAYTIDTFGKEHVIQFTPENWWATDKNCFFFGEPSLFYIEAIEDTNAIHIRKSFYEKADRIIPNFSAFQTLILHNSIRFMQKRINLLLSATAETRYLDFMKLYPNLIMRVPQTMIASYLGITPESLSRVRKMLSVKHV